MTVSAMSPSVAVPGLVPSAGVAATPQLGALNGVGMPVGVQSALVGAQPQAEQPGIASRMVAAMRAAIAELRGRGASDAQINQHLLAMKAQADAQQSAASAVATPSAVRIATAKPKAKVKAKGAGAAKAKAKGAGAAKAKAKPKAKSTPKAGAAAPKVSGAAAGIPGVSGVAAGATTAGVAGAAGTQLPENATQFPGGTVYSYADAANPSLAGLQGLTPQQQLQLGVMPSGLGSTLGMYGQAADATPQANVTNQSNLGGVGVLGTMGLAGLVPTIGAPITSNTNLSTPPAAPTAPTAGTPTNAGAQRVVNRNEFDSRGLGQQPGFGAGWPGAAYPYSGGVATPYSPYGASMTGASLVGASPSSASGGILGWFSRLFS